MTQENCFEIIINGYAEEPVAIHINPGPDVILGIIHGRIHHLSTRTSVSGILIEGDVYLWDGEVCKVAEFLNEWRGDDMHDLEDTFWMEIEDDGELQVSLMNRSLRHTKVFRDLATASKVSFI
jgi:hypothetical protein